jgi:excisionase family DNA binding protein
MSPETAAQVAGTTRWTIMRAIKSQRLPATRDDRNQWRITLEDLGTWQRAHLGQSAPTVQQDAVAQPAHERAQGIVHPDEALRVEIQALRREVERLERDLVAEKARTDGLSGEVAAERARAEAEANRANREGAAADDLRARLTRAEDERRALVDHIAAMAARMPEPVPAPRRGFLARLLGT